MKRLSLIYSVIALQLVVLATIIGCYEYVKATGQTIYIPVTGYDPTDIFRGDYVNIAYELPIEQGSGSTSDYDIKYLVPKVE